MCSFRGLVAAEKWLQRNGRENELRHFLREGSWGRKGVLWRVGVGRARGGGAQWALGAGGGGGVATVLECAAPLFEPGHLLRRESAQVPVQLPH